MNLKALSVGLCCMFLIVGCKAIKQDIVYGDPISYGTASPDTINYNDIVRGNYETSRKNYLAQPKVYKKKLHKDVVEAKQEVKTTYPTLAPVRKKIEITPPPVTSENTLIKKSISSLIKGFKTLEKRENNLAKKVSLLKNSGVSTSSTDDKFTMQLMKIIDGMHSRMNKLEQKISNVGTKNVVPRHSFKLENEVKALREEVKTLSFRKTNSQKQVDLSAINNKLNVFSTNINSLKRGLSGVIQKMDRKPKEITPQVEYEKVAAPRKQQGTNLQIINNIKNRFIGEDEPTSAASVEPRTSFRDRKVDDVFATFKSLKNGAYKAVKNIKVYAFSNDKDYLIDEIKAGETFKLEECYDCNNMLFRKIDGIEGYIKNR